MKLASGISRRLTIFVLLWLVLTGAAPESLPYGVFAVAAATLLSLRLYPAKSPSVVAWRVARLLPRLLIQGFLGGIDVARRAFDPRLPVASGWMRFPLASRHDSANVLLGGVISILPGTLAAGPGDGVMEVHALNLPDLSSAGLTADERRILDLFDCRVEPMAGSHG